ncbi:MAG: hypothetical protein K5945_08460 [Bacteroidaceae bacterium]|nr:hypothetical protein [Bacteroidaceae bacterium]
MKYTKIIALGILLTGMQTGGRAQVFQVFEKGGNTTKFQAADVDSISHSDAEGLTTIYLRDGKTQTFRKAETDSVVWYDPAKSILSTLRKQGNFTNFIRLMEENALWTDFLNGATDLTVFASDDDHWRSFFAENAKLPEGNPWRGATSYERLSRAQKRLLASASIGHACGEGSAWRGKKMRVGMFVSPIDSIPILTEGIPRHYNSGVKDYWAQFRPENGGRGIALLTDHSQPMTLMLTPEFLRENNITDEDYAIITGGKAMGKTLVNGAKEESKTPTGNGCLHTIDRPIVPLSSMAEVIRTNGRTDIFSHILDRYCAPFYDEELTLAKKAEDPEWTDSIFVKRYFSDNSYGHLRLSNEPDNHYLPLSPYNPYLDEYSYDIIPSLKFDPAWHGYYDEVPPERDMAAMFVPSDEAMWRYFKEGGGQQLILTYANISMLDCTTKEELFQAIDQIPLGTMQAFVNIIMMRSFVGSVPSKMTRLRDDAQEQLFYAEDREKIDTCLLASNGAVYVMDAVYGPADYLSVTAPAYLSTSNNIIKWAIYNGSSGTDYMGTNFYTYLKAPQQDITFFLPSDEAMQFYYDPASFNSTSKRLIQFSYRNQAFPINTKCVSYDPATGTVGRPFSGQGASVQQAEVTNRLKDVLYSHVILNNERQNIHSRNEYFETLGGTIVRVVRDEAGHITQVMGGFQMENQRQGISKDTLGIHACNVTQAFETLKNGETYTLDAPTIPTWRSAYSILTDDEGWERTENEAQWYATNPYARFFTLCEVDEGLISGCGLVDNNMSQSERRSAMRKYTVFERKNGLDYNLQFAENESLTLYVPTNEAIEAAIAQGLPTWDDIASDYESHCKTERYEDGEGNVTEEPTSQLASFEDSLRIQEKINRLTSFIRGHFHYGAALADKEPAAERAYTIPYIDPELGIAPKLKVHALGNGEMTVTDAQGTTRRVVGQRNVLARDIQCSSSPVGVPMSTSSKRITLDGASNIVIHQIDGVLGFTK